MDFDHPGAEFSAAGELLQSVGTIRINGRAGNEQVRISANNAKHVIIGHQERSGSISIDSAVAIHPAIPSLQHTFVERRAFYHSDQLLNVGLVYIRLPIEVEQPQKEWMSPMLVLRF
jgi:hypothetical protein